ncbi:MAG: Ig-like domain-containing protein [Wenzhouxiangellaceae bacterium]
MKTIARANDNNRCPRLPGEPFPGYHARFCNRYGLSGSVASLAVAVLLLVGLSASASQGFGDAASIQPIEAGIPEGLSAEGWDSIQRQVRLQRYQARAAESGGYTATNPAQGLDIRYRVDGTTEVTAGNTAGASGTLGLRLAGVGYRDLHPVGDEPRTLVNEGHRLTYAWGGGLTEWWVNARDGLEQWFELETPPAGRSGGDRLRVALAVSGDYQASETGDGVVFRHGNTRLAYTGLVVWDATGRRLPARLEVAGARLMLSVNDAGARYPVTIDPTLSQQAYLKASNTDGGDRFGHSIALDGDTVVIGAVSEGSNATGVDGDETDNSASGAGAAYVFTRDGDGAWSQQAYLKASNTDSEDQFGYSVALDGNTVVVGAPLEDSSATGVDGDQTDNSASVAGAVYVFTRDGTGAWSQQAYLKASNTEEFDRFGESVAIAGGTVVVGANGEDSNATGVDGDQTDNSAGSAGAAYVFTRDGDGIWSQQAYLKASNTDVQDFFGGSVAADGDTVVVGAVFEDSNTTGVDGDQTDNSAGSAGAAYVFTRNGDGIWSQQAYLKASNTGANDLFARAIAVDGDTVVVGANGEDSNATGVDGDQTDNSAFGAGAAYVFTRDGTGTWSQQAYLKASTTNFDDSFGTSVAVDGDTVAVGAWFEDSNATGTNGDQTDNSASSAGAVYVFTRDGAGTWSQQAYLKASNTDGGDWFGGSVAVESDTVIVGATREDSNATGVDGDESDNSAGWAGAVYVFVPNHPPVAQDDTVATDEDTVLNGDVLADNGNGADSDPEGGTLTVSQVNGSSGDVGSQVTLSSGALLTQNANGTFSYDPNGQFESLGGGDTASDSFTYTVSDGSATDSATVSVTINGVNDPPVADSRSVTTLEDTAVGITLTGADMDDDALTFSVTAGPVNGTLSGTAPDLTYDPNPDYNGPDSFDFEVCDPQPRCDTATVNITVDPVNDPPTFTAGGDVQTFEDTTFDAPWASSISAGPPDEAGQRVSFMVTDNTNPDLFETPPTVDGNGQLSFTPTPDTNGSAEITMKALDDGGTASGGDPISDPATFTVEVIAAADLAIDKTSGSFFTPPGGRVSYAVQVTNRGPSDIIDARVQDDPPMRLGDLAWSCTPQGNAVCNAGAMGPIDELVTIPEGDSVIFTLDATLQDTDNDPITNTAGVIAPDGLTELDTGNNTDSDTNLVGLFADGFESVEPD